MTARARAVQSSNIARRHIEVTAAIGRNCCHPIEWRASPTRVELASFGQIHCSRTATNAASTRLRTSSLRKIS